VDDGWLKDEDLFGTADLAMQLEAIEAMEGVKPDATVAEGSVSGGGGGAKKKKKKQKITLMSTGGRRGQ
jgi:hypothetical protein